MNMGFMGRSIDIAGSLAGLMLGAPIIAAVGVTAACVYGSPIIISKRMGLGGVPFDMYKFRTSSVETSSKKEAPWKQKLGNFLRSRALDEIPQFINILKGDMTFVGLRPFTVEEYEQLHVPNGYKNSIDTRPGVTGTGTLFSIRNPVPLTLEQKLASDEIKSPVGKLLVLFGSVAGVLMVGHGGNQHNVEKIEKTETAPKVASPQPHSSLPALPQ